MEKLDTYFHYLYMETEVSEDVEPISIIQTLYLELKINQRKWNFKNTALIKYKITITPDSLFRILAISFTYTWNFVKRPSQWDLIVSNSKHLHLTKSIWGSISNVDLLLYFHVRRLIFEWGQKYDKSRVEPPHTLWAIVIYHIARWRQIIPQPRDNH